MRKRPADLQLIEADGWWTLSFGRYSYSTRSCTCERVACTCKRHSTIRWRSTDHHERFCHAGHPEHLAVILRNALR
jgi:hypothetical protein